MHRQDVLESRHDDAGFDATQIAQAAGLPWRTAQAWKAGLVVDSADARRCEQAVAQLRGSQAKSAKQDQDDFLTRLDSNFKAGQTLLARLGGGSK